MPDPLGAQTVTVIEKISRGRGELGDGSRTVYAGCLLEWMPESVQEFNDREQRSEDRARLHAPPGFRARAQDEVEVVPGPVDDAGAPVRLKMIGAAKPRWDDEGVEDHVVAMLRLRSG